MNAPFTVPADQLPDCLRRDNDGMPLLPNLKLSRTPEDSMAINGIRSGAIVIAGSGMCNGGRIVHHLKHNLGREETQVLITGYQAVGTLGRRLVEREESVQIHGRSIPVRAAIHTLGGFSAHGDQDDLARWYEGMENRPRRSWCTAAETGGTQAYGPAQGAAVHLPEAGRRPYHAVGPNLVQEN
jgi:Cft2 family RNA processing exonuclease